MKKEETGLEKGNAFAMSEGKATKQFVDMLLDGLDRMIEEAKPAVDVNDRIAQLLEENRYVFDGKFIAFDGAVDEQAYRDSATRTVFLLKEVNNPDMQEDWKDFMKDVRDETSKENPYKTWPNVCMWMETLFNGDTTYEECIALWADTQNKPLQQYLRQIAVVNLKKTAGGGSSSYKELLDAVEKYGHVIYQELELLRPRLVVCGGTFELARKMMDVREECVKTLPCGAEYFMDSGVMYLQFVHPMWFSVNRKILYAYAREVFRDVRKVLD